MSQFSGIIAVCGLLLAMFGSLAYLRDTLRGHNAPNRASFLLWALAPAIALMAQLDQGVTWPAITTFAAALGPASILAASFASKSGKWQLTQFDYFCGALSILAIVFWKLSGNGNVAITFSILADGLASLPTIVKAYRHPETETGWTYGCSALNGLTGGLSATSIRFDNLAFPTYLFLAMGLITVLCVYPRQAKNQGRKMSFDFP